MSPRRSGYILIETAVALAILSLGALTVNTTIREAIQTRGQSQDFTRARFLLDRVMADITAEPVLTAGRESGQFAAPDNRFSWDATIRRVEMPPPTRPLKPNPREKPKKLKFPEYASYLAHVRVTVRWSRGRMDFEESYDTLLPPEQLWQPPPKRRRGAGR